MNSTKQCRICFGHERAQTFVSPCACRGSSAYIHLSCLEKYIHHYPDRICRVCYQYMDYSTKFDTVMLGILYVWLTILISISNASEQTKLIFVGVLLALVNIRRFRLYIHGYVSTIILFSTLMLVNTARTNIYNSILLLSGFIGFLTLLIFIPHEFVLFILVVGLLMIYGTTVVLYFAQTHDTYMVGCFLALVLLCWGVAVQAHRGR